MGVDEGSGKIKIKDSGEGGQAQGITLTYSSGVIDDIEIKTEASQHPRRRHQELELVRRAKRKRGELGRDRI